MNFIRVGAAVLNQTPLDWDGNLSRIRAAIAQARAQDVSLLCLPELCITGYGCEDAFPSAWLLDAAWEALEAILPETRGMAVSFGMPLLVHNALFNTACLAVDGELLGFVAKQFLAADGLHYEPRWFRPWQSGQRLEVERHGRRFPVGDLIFDIGGVRIGFEICEDAWVADRPGSVLALEGVDIVLNPSASHFAFNKLEVRSRFVLEGSRAFGISYVYANLVGNEAGRAIYDGGALIATAGRLAAVGRRFIYQEQEVTSAVIDVDRTRMAQARTGSFRPALRPSAREVRCPFVLPSAAIAEQEPGQAPWECGPHLKEEEFTRATALALFDYLRKSRARGFVISSSGGADSAACVCLVALMVELAIQDLGLPRVLERLGYIDGIATCRSPRELVSALLTTVYQRTENSSERTQHAAAAVAAGVGATHHVLDIGALVGAYRERVEAAIGRTLTWEQDDIALQNIQARVRSPGVWMLANLKSALLLATSNRSEAAVGYATMDGDTSGGLSPIAGIDKNFLRHWLRWLERQGPQGLHGLPALSWVNAQQPTAELRPPGCGQTDEGDLMPYPVLDAIERLAIRDKRSPLEVLSLLEHRLAEYPPAQLGAWVERFFLLWSRNQWKRERYAPSFHVDDENLDPRSWCRFPILSGGFERELAELRAELEARRRK